jgi:hypothetical protein
VKVGGCIPMARQSHHNKDSFEEVLKVKALPSMQVYGGGLWLDSFPCPPTMFSALTRKVLYWDQERINPITLTLTNQACNEPVNSLWKTMTISLFNLEKQRYVHDGGRGGGEAVKKQYRPGATRIL